MKSIFQRSLIVTALISCLLASGIVAAANLPLLTGPIPASDIQSALNQLIQSINSGTAGLLNAQTGSVATGGGTSEQTLQTFVLPGGTLATAGQTIKVTAFGKTASNSNNKTFKLYFGSEVVSSGTTTINNGAWTSVLYIMKTGASTQIVQGAFGGGGSTGVQYNATGAETDTAGVTIKLTGQDGTDSAGDITCNGMITEIIK